MARRKRLATADAVEILYRRYYEGRPERVKRLDEARANDSVARKLTALLGWFLSTMTFCFGRQIPRPDTQNYADCLAAYVVGTAKHYSQ